MIYIIIVLFLLIFGWEGVIVIGALVLRPIVIFLGIVCVLGIILMSVKTYEKYERGGFKTAEEMRIESEIAGQQAVDQFIKEQKEEKNKFGRLK